MFRTRFTVLMFAAFAVLFLFPTLNLLLTDWWWFREIGYQVVFSRELTTKWLVFLAVGGLTAGLVFVRRPAAGRSAGSGRRN